MNTGTSDVYNNVHNLCTIFGNICFDEINIGLMFFSVCAGVRACVPVCFVCSYPRACVSVCMCVFLDYIY